MLRWHLLELGGQMIWIFGSIKGAIVEEGIVSSFTHIVVINIIFILICKLLQHLHRIFFVI